MLAWLSSNLINIALVAVIVLVIWLVIRGMLRRKKAGKCACGESCASCAACCSCAGCTAEDPARR